jgi:stage III sporulation protein AB
MIKIIGAICIIIATSWIGFEASKALTERTRQIRILKSALQSLEAEIMYGHTPLHEASRRIAKLVGSPVKDLFECFAMNLIKGDTTASNAWVEALEHIWKRTAFKTTELEILKQFGETLGKHDLVQQQKQIRLALTHLEREEEEARDKQTSYGKMFRNLGILTGLFIIILLM